ncbi:MAG: hypothetical protein JWQ38_2861 [Flavipsychrobacter sp.]|nr:hypothetical protein [Flavipsychrobacter sp.]
MNIFSSFKALLLAPLFLLTTGGAKAQETDYLRHGKVFDLCSYKYECSNCNNCGKQRFKVKINNKSNLAIKNISYVFYSAVFNKVLTKPATIKADRINAREIGYAYICIPEGGHWAISELEYADGSKMKFVVHERLENFIQEPDECDCND